MIIMIFIILYYDIIMILLKFLMIIKNSLLCDNYQYSFLYDNMFNGRLSHISTSEFTTIVGPDAFISYCQRVHNHSGP